MNGMIISVIFHINDVHPQPLDRFQHQRLSGTERQMRKYVTVLEPFVKLRLFHQHSPYTIVRAII